METLLHIGFEHPSAVWMFAAAVVAFVAGAGFGAYLSRRSSGDDSVSHSPTDET